MSTERVTDTHCHVCSRQMTIMKRCTRCRNVLYCSQDCQRDDWPAHKNVCGVKESHAADTINTNKQKTKVDRGDGRIFDEDTPKTDRTKIHPPLVDFSKAIPKQVPSKDENCKQYLFKNEFYSDIPEVDDPDQTCEVTLKCNKQKQKLKVQKTWTGKDLFKFLSYSLAIPLENVKLIHKGKVLSVDTVIATVQNKAVYQVIGEMAEREEDIDQRDISVMMKQCGLDRNKAIQMLRKKGDLLDALLDQ